MNIDLNELSLKELRDLQTQVARAITSYEDRRKKAALVELEEKARALGFSSLSELTGAPAQRKRSVISPKYANPADRSQTWTGRGRKPGWFIDALAAGKSPDDLAI
ncbi:H-NS family nucleoid-associated regulatory protein [Szabonella alba]|uniref:H-NS histone family protein n=1 Tax=Szabonella alba TaxID=2804194 RepID=A0A8K0VAG9_9RHOB|nr:H-NS histone family protein [Szabonella alba]MBL4916618.1 H-NS histone family protein [Szabonella alba]